MKDKLKTAAGALVFAAIFGAVGVFASWVIVASLWDAHRAREWILTSATVDFWDSDNVGYHYKVGDQEYRGDRLGAMVIGGKDSIDSWHDDMDAMLTAAKNDKKPVMVRVNPDNPAESMVNADMRWQPLVFFVPFALGFSGVALSALWVMFRIFVPARGKDSGLLTTWFFTIMWNSIAMPIAFLAVPNIIAEGEWVGLLVLLFPLIGVLLLWGALYGTWKAFIGLFNRGGSAGGLDMNKKAKNAPWEEMAKIREMANEMAEKKKKPKMVETNPEVILRESRKPKMVESNMDVMRELQQDNGVKPHMVGMVSAPLADGASRRLAQEDALEAQARAMG
ncbi:MAG: hypothetical protein ABIQ72_05645, partial [Usitatibacter sp.]